MVREFGADPAATDCARVMRIPGFMNHKRHPVHVVRAERLSESICTPDQFPQTDHEGRRSVTPGLDVESGSSCKRRGHLSQSELDWAYAKRALSRGETPESVATAIANYRRGEKANAEYYARLTVRKAAAALANREPSILVSTPER
jgi:hypothetical protein